MNQIEGSICVITGASAGIGKATATEMARLGARVVMVCRNRERGRKALVEICHASGSSSVDLLLADLSVQAEVRALASRIASDYPQVDVLINNAGLFRWKRELTADGLEMTFAVNHLAYFLLTLSLLDTLRESAPSRIINVSSAAHRGATMDFGDLQGENKFRGFRAYRRSKLANLMFTYELARRLESTGVTTNAVHPGMVASRFGRPGNGLFSVLFRAAAPLMRSPEEGARTTIYLASSPDLDGVNGGYFVNEKQIESSTASHDTEAAQRLWSESLALTGFDEDPLPLL